MLRREPLADALTFRVAGRLLERGVSPYDAGELAWAAATAVAFVFAVSGATECGSGRSGPGPRVDCRSLSGVLTVNALLGQTGAFVGALVVAAAWLWRRYPLGNALTGSSSRADNGRRGSSSAPWAAAADTQLSGISSEPR